MNDTLAALGGAPVRVGPFPAWPVVADAERHNLLAALEGGDWSDPAGGRFVREFERVFAGLHELPHAVAVTSGSVALTMALRALGVGYGAEVIVPSYTFLATATAVIEANALPVFADIDPATLCLASAAVEAAITRRTRAIMPVHFGGHPADMDALGEIASRHGLAVVEDCAHAHGSVWTGRPVGGWGVIGAFSLQASKNLTSGEGGVLVTADESIAERLVSLRNCGRERNGAPFEHRIFGASHRMTEFQAAVLLAQVERYPAQLAQRDTNGPALDSSLGAIDGIVPQRRDRRTDVHAYHLYSLRYDPESFAGLTRDRFCALLRAEGIPAGAGYPVPLHRQPLFAAPGFDSRATGSAASDVAARYASLDLPETERACDEIVWIPQQVLLGGARDIGDVIAAVEKIRRIVDRDGLPAID